MLRFTAFVFITLAIASGIPVAMTILGLGDISISVAIVLHFFSVVFVGVGFFLLMPKKGDRGEKGNIWWVYAVASSAVAPVYGVCSTVAIYILQRIMKKGPSPIVGEDITVPSEEVFAKPPLRAKQLEILERLDIEPFAEIFRRGKSALKKSAIHFLSTTPSRESVEMLYRALEDEDIEVRLYASGIIGIIDDSFTKEINIRISRFRANSGDVVLGIDLADIYRAYAESGLADEVSRNHYYREAVNILMQLPEDKDVYYHLANALFSMKNSEDALHYIEKCLVLDQTNFQARILRCRILFSLGQYIEVAKTMSVMKDDGLAKPEDPLTIFWT